MLCSMCWLAKKKQNIKIQLCIRWYEYFFGQLMHLQCTVGGQMGPVSLLQGDKSIEIYL